LDYAVLDYIFEKLQKQEYKDIFTDWVNMGLSMED
jgi:hypothetical protein